MASPGFPLDVPGEEPLLELGDMLDLIHPTQMGLGANGGPPLPLHEDSAAAAAAASVAAPSVPGQVFYDSNYYRGCKT